MEITYKKNHHRWANGCLILIQVLVILAWGCSPHANQETDLTGQGANSGRENNEPRTDLAIYANGRFLAIAENIATEAVYLKTGSSQQEAFHAALEECELFSDSHAYCVVTRTFDTGLHPRMTGETSSQWACFTRELQRNNETLAETRAWLATDKTLLLAKKKALSLCQAEGGIECRILRCFNSDSDKDA